MSVLTQSRLRGGLMAGASLSAVILGMAVMDPRIHKQVDHLVHGKGLSPEVASVVHRAQQIAMTSLGSVRDYSMDHAPLTIFALAALILLLFMFRT